MKPKVQVQLFNGRVIKNVDLNNNNYMLMCNNGRLRKDEAFRKKNIIKVKLD